VKRLFWYCAEHRRAYIAAYVVLWSTVAALSGVLASLLGAFPGACVGFGLGFGVGSITSRLSIARQMWLDVTAVKIHYMVDGLIKRDVQ